MEKRNSQPDSQWSQKEACCLRATWVWHAVNHITSVTSGK